MVRNQAETAEDAESTSEHQRIQYAMFRFFPDFVVFDGSFSCGMVCSRVKRTPESEKKQMSVYLIKRKIKKKILVSVPGTYISPFVLLIALEGGVNSNLPGERLFLRTANPRRDQNSYVHG